jgi:cell division transport system permease protein
VISFVLFSISRAVQGFWRNLVMSLAATATMVLMLMLLAGFWIIQTGLLAGLQFTEQKVEVVADIRDSALQPEIDTLVAKMQGVPEIATVTFISKDQALSDFRARLAEQGEEDLTRYLDSNPLHASLEIKLKDPKVFGNVVDQLRAQSIVENVKEQQKLVDQVTTVTNILRTAGTVVLLIVGVIALFIIVNTIRLAVLARAEEIEIMRLVGASDAFIRWPFVFEGALVGLIGAIATLAILAAASDPLGRFMVGFFEVLPLQFGSLTRDLVVLVMGAGVGLGVLGSWVSVRTYLICGGLGSGANRFPQRAEARLPLPMYPCALAGTPQPPGTSHRWMPSTPRLRPSRPPRPPTPTARAPKTRRGDRSVGGPSSPSRSP